ncbi:MAG: hypothetical protein JXQ29_05770 [Planctomycetes bacterium]|nr:hypothetical protein [Planctomycetota bacterium]
MLRAWCLFAAAGTGAALLADGAAGGFPAGGRVLLGSLLAFHLLVVPALGPAGGSEGILWQGALRAFGQAALLALLFLPPARVVAGMTGADWEQMALAAGMVFLAHLLGAAAEHGERCLPGFLRFGYWPVVVLIAAGLPLIVYAGHEFLGLGSIPFDGAPFGPLVGLLDGAR